MGITFLTKRMENNDGDFDDMPGLEEVPVSDFKNLRGMGSHMFGVFPNPEGFDTLEVDKLEVVLPLLKNGANIAMTSSVGNHMVDRLEPEEKDALLNSIKDIVKARIERAKEFILRKLCDDYGFDFDRVKEQEPAYTEAKKKGFVPYREHYRAIDVNQVLAEVDILMILLLDTSSRSFGMRTRAFEKVKRQLKWFEDSDEFRPLVPGALTRIGDGVINKPSSPSIRGMSEPFAEITPSIPSIPSVTTETTSDEDLRYRTWDFLLRQLAKERGLTDDQIDHQMTNIPDQGEIFFKSAGHARASLSFMADTLMAANLVINPGAPLSIDYKEKRDKLRQLVKHFEQNEELRENVPLALKSLDDE